MPRTLAPVATSEDPADRGDPPRPLDPPMVPFAVVGTVVWALTGLAMLPFRHRLAAAGHGSWLPICLAGVLWGLVGIAGLVRHDAARRRRRGG